MSKLPTVWGGHIMLFDGERIKWEKKVQKKPQISDEEINKKYLAGEVRIVTEQARYPLDTIMGMIDSGKYELMPSFQRRHRWNAVKKSRLIESFIMNVPIPPIFLYENEYSHYEVMDGLQRMTTIYEFYQDKFALTGLEQWAELNGKVYSALPEKIKQGIDRRYLSSIILLHESAKDQQKAQEMKQLVFERINSGGVKLEPQETRNALYDGPMNQLCVALSRNKYLCLLFGIPNIESLDMVQMHFDQWDDVPEGQIEEEFEAQLDSNVLYASMADVELVLRYFAVRNLDGYINQFHDFLDSYLIISNNFSDELLAKLKNSFEEVILFAYELFEEKAFYLWRPRKTKDGEKWGWFERSTTTVYDPLMYVLTEMLEKKELYIAKAEKIRTDITAMYKKNYSIFEGRNSNRSDIEKRIAAYQKFFSRYIEE